MVPCRKTYIALLSGFFCLIALTAFAQETLQPQANFIKEAFDGATAQRKAMWITKDLRSGIKKILGRDLGVLRVRYWQKGERTAWILEEIGKEEPITTAVIINEGKIEQVKVLVYRESRGGEVQYPFFTNQFKGLFLDKRKELSHSIDGITGATLSVRALKKIAKLALYLDGAIAGSYEK
ncbi:MAG: FMN-binding protein [Deltaproteobacteria bacterium]|nr:FMN-binding protein [Deltaproteobacteria bacterium]